MTNNQNTLRQSQLLMLEGLIEIDRICKNNNIAYWLDAGTLLGAVRHQGFIPWDDDIDICMTRLDYEHFLDVASVELDQERFFLQTEQTDPHYIAINIPCKVRLNNTQIIEDYEVAHDCYRPNAHHGVFVDIFPYDKYSTNKTQRYLERSLSIPYRLNVLSHFKNLSPIKWALSRIGALIFNRSVLNFLKPIYTKYINQKKEHYAYGAGCETPFSRAYFSDDELFPIGQICFEGHMFSCPNQVHEYLIKMFGPNYMTPPEEKKQHGSLTLPS